MPIEENNEATSRIFAVLERVLFLKDVDIFKNVDTERLSVVAEIAREGIFSAGEEISREGDPGESLYILKSGSMRVVKERNHKPYTLKNLKPGESFGLFGVFGEQLRSSGAVANENSVVYEIRRNEFKKVLIANPEIAYNILEILSARLSEMDKEIVLLNQALSGRLTETLQPEIRTKGQ